MGKSQEIIAILKKQGKHKLARAFSSEVKATLDGRTLDQLVEMAAESAELGNSDDARATRRSKDEAKRFGKALEKELLSYLKKTPLTEERSSKMTASEQVAELMDNEAEYLVLMTLMGHGVGIWDGRWDEFFVDPKKEIPPLQKHLERKLGKFADDTGGGSLPMAFEEDAFETADPERYEEEYASVATFKKNIIAAMLDAGKPDLATAMSKAQASPQQIVTAAPGYARTVGAGTFDYEGEEAGVRIVSSPPRVHAHVYYPIANIGKRGKHVEVTSYQLFAPSKKDQREATSAVKSALKSKKGASTHQILTSVRSAFLATERKSIETQAKYPARFYEAAKNQLGGMDPSIPSHSGSTVYSSRRGRDVGVIFDKPAITITSRRSSAVAGKGGQYHYLTVSWSQVKKVNKVAEALSKLRGLESVQDALAMAGIKYKVHQYADPMWAA